MTTTEMGPPLPRNPSAANSESRGKTPEEPSISSYSPSESANSSMGPPPPKFANPQQPESEIKPYSDDTSSSMASQADDSLAAEDVDSKVNSSSSSKDKDDSPARKQGEGVNDIPVPYTIPAWNGPPCHQYFVEVLKDGAIIDQFDVYKKGAYMFGRVDLCDFALDHPTISRFHAVIQYKMNGEAYLYDLGSTHGTFINKNQVKKKDYVRLNVGDVIRFGQSSRLYIFQGPTDLMPPEADLKSMHKAKIQEEMQDMEASLLRAKLEASLADGISWGMREDAIEEAEDDVDEITWQNYKGQLTEKQKKTRDKVVKRLEKIAHMKKEIEAIRAKDISQGGLTQGQQTQIARNEQRISQIMEELENLEETLNESIRESMGACAGKTTRGKKMGVTEEDEDYMSDDDQFYDRTKKLSNRKIGENQSIETAETLLGKKEEINTEIEIKRKLLLAENEKVPPNEVTGEGDALDAYMSSVSSQLALDKKDQLQKDLASLQLELDRVLYLLKIADPTGEAALKRDSNAQEPIPNVATAASDPLERPPLVKGQSNRVKHSLNGSSDKPSTLQNNSILKESIPKVTTESNLKLEGSEKVSDNVTDDSTTACSIVKPQWLGAVEDLKKHEKVEEAPVDMQEKDQFVDYKERKTILEKADIVNETSGIENAAAGLIIRKRKQVEKPEAFENSEEAKRKVEDTVAMLLRHSRAHHAADEEGLHVENEPHVKLARRDKTAQRVLGPERPSFLSDESVYDSWVPPEGQSGDGRTSLNDRYGY